MLKLLIVLGAKHDVDLVPFVPECRVAGNHQNLLREASFEEASADLALRLGVPVENTDFSAVNPWGSV
jgi:hypothetical protein